MRKIQLKVSVAALIAVLLIGAPMRAQVTIGTLAEPSEGALLDLKEYPSNQSVTSTKGLGLPRVQLTDLTKLYPMFDGSYDPAENAAHVGLTVYHVQGGCLALLPGGIYVWDGTKWNDIYVNPPAPAPSGTVDIVVKVNANGNGTSDPDTPCRRVLRFMTSNMGADPDMTPKQQMAYTSGGSTDMTVFGDLYQWGRKTDGHEKRNSTTTSSKPADPANVGDQFVTGSSNWLNSAVADLWGNGGGLDAQTNTTYTGSQNVNNPCPDGYRVPTEHEWALLGNEGESATSTPNDEIPSMTASGSSGNSSGIVWVPVSGGTASTGWSSGVTCGYALYAAGDWNTATEKTNLLADNAPEPLLFLPAGGIRLYNDGDVGYTGSDGCYWSSVVNGTNSYYMGFYGSYVNATNDDSRAGGMSVRCVAAE
jgi:uncharacterized protein (TIGR02145 family)